VTECPHRQVSLDWTDPAARLVGEPPRVEAAFGWCVTCGRQVCGTEARAPAQPVIAPPSSPPVRVWEAREVMAPPLPPSDRTRYAPAGWVPPTRAPTPPEPSTLTCTDVDWPEDPSRAPAVGCQRAATHSSCDGVVCPAHRCRCSAPLPGPIPLSERCHYALPDGRFCVGHRGHDGDHEAAPGGVAAIVGRWPGDETDEEIAEFFATKRETRSPDSARASDEAPTQTSTGSRDARQAQTFSVLDAAEKRLDTMIEDSGSATTPPRRHTRRGPSPYPDCVHPLAMRSSYIEPAGATVFLSGTRLEHVRVGTVCGRCGAVDPMETSHGERGALSVTAVGRAGSGRPAGGVRGGDGDEGRGGER